MLRAALRYLEHGWRPIPVKAGTKDKPLVKWKPYQDRAPTEAEVREWWTRCPEANIALLTGRGTGLVVVDVDGPGAEAKVRSLLGPVPTLTIKTSRGRQFYLRAPEWPVKCEAPVGGVEGLDVRGEGGYVIAPPSLHPSGARYRAETKAAPAPMPEALAAFLRAAQEEPDGTRRRAEPVGERLTKGARNSTLTSLAGTMRRRGMSEEGIAAALLVENAQRCDPPLDEEEVRRIAASIAKKDPAEDPATAAKPRSEPIPFRPILDGAAPPPPTMLVDRLLVDADVNVEAGPGGSGKTTSILHLAVCLTVGRPVFGMLPVRRPGPVLLVCPEDGEGAVRMMVESIVTGLDLTEVERTTLAARLFIMPDDELLDLRTGTVCLGRAAQDWGAVLVVLDPLRNLIGDADEIDNTVAGVVLDALRRDVCRRAGAAVLLSHHIRKPDRRLGKSEPSIHEMRGAGAWGAGARLAFDVALQDGIVTLTCTKANRVRQGFAHRLRLTIEAEPGEQESVWRRCRLESLQSESDLTPGLFNGLSDKERDMLAALHDPQEPKRQLSWTQWLKRSGIESDKTFDRNKKRLGQAGLVGTTDTGKFTNAHNPIYLFWITDKGREALAAYQEPL